MACVFCCRTGLTKEHVVPRWMGDVLARSQRDPEGRAPPRAAAITHVYEPPRGSRVAARSWSKGDPDLQVRAVCSSCNSGWMNDLESPARLILTALVQGRRLELEPDDQASLAAGHLRLS